MNTSSTSRHGSAESEPSVSILISGHYHLHQHLNNNHMIMVHASEGLNTDRRRGQQAGSNKAACSAPVERARLRSSCPSRPGAG
eukprot:19903-Eustigmatos_ZCMA.PRE.1